ncbi:hypothetical protein [Cellvibrio sp. BR]|uniref:hypothetical protein n=1 Tax=Cellvibrio sp. BR TaxID=1134474 RepID=UPI000313BAE1|nr:hypothetical protein [Cellvibrio sp. BR]
MQKKKPENIALPEHYSKLKQNEQIHKMATRKGITLEAAKSIIMERAELKNGIRKKTSSNNKIKVPPEKSNEKNNPTVILKNSKKTIKKKKYKKIDMLDCWWSRLSGCFEAGKK